MSYNAKENQLFWSQASVQAGDTTANTATETIFASKPDVFTANSLNVGDIVRGRARGLFSTSAISLATFTFRVKLGSVAFYTSTALSLALNLTNRPWEVTFEFLVRAVGASGSIDGLATSALSTVAGSTSVDMMTNSAPVTIDTTADQQLQLSLQQSLAVLGSTATLRHFMVEKLRTAP